MATLVVQGNARLSGRVDVEGNKNAALPLLAACLLSDNWCQLENVPRIRDVEVMVALLETLGADVEGQGTSTIRIRCREILSDEPDPTLVGKLRGSVLLMGPLLARRGRVRLAPPGGDFPTRRTIATHLQALGAFGAISVVSDAWHMLDCAAGLHPASVYLDEASVTGTETALLAAATTVGVSEIRHAAAEPHVVELCRFLQALGVGVEGAGTSTIRVHGRAHLGEARHRLDGDYIEAGSWAVVGAVTGSELDVAGARQRISSRSCPSCAACTCGATSTASPDGPPVEGAGGAQHHHRTLARVPERSRQSRHGPGHSG